MSGPTCQRCKALCWSRCTLEALDVARLDHRPLLPLIGTLEPVLVSLRTLLTQLARQQQTHDDRLEELAYSVKELEPGSRQLADNTELQSQATAPSANGSMSLNGNC